MSVRAARVWTTDSDQEVTLDHDPGTGIFFDTGAGVVMVYVEGEELVVCNGEFPFDLIVKPHGSNDIRVSVDGWQDSPLEGELCNRCGTPAAAVYVWKATGERVGSCTTGGAP